MRRLLTRAPALLLLAAPAAAQSLNVDVGTNVAFPAPSSAYAAAGAAGVWNPVAAPASQAPLVGLDGLSTAVTLTSLGGFLNFDYDNPATSGEAGLLLDDVQDLGGPTSMVTWSFAGLQDGEYTLFTYAWAPDNASFRTRVTVPGSPDAAVDVGGVWSGAHVEGVSHARHRASVSGGALVVQLATSSGFGSLNGFQLVRAQPFEALCAGDGGGAPCPCGNSGGAGRGCANSVDAAGGLLQATGWASVGSDSLALLGSGMPNSSALYFQGTSAAAAGAGTAFGDGLRCAAGSVVRLGTKTNGAGASQYPTGGDPSVSVRGGVAPGDTRVYQVWYRNAAAFCTADTFNLTNGLRVQWAP
ncbi:MAG: hypothetical protein JNK02_17310 [Planctomycetes bacterium]|nr:hypothetical protein [Planctomycetota bacterium]